MNSYPSPQYRQEDQDQNGILRALGGIALTAGAGAGLLYGLNPRVRQSARQWMADFVNDPKSVENIQKVRAASPETKTAAFRSEKLRGNQVVDLNSTERLRKPQRINLNPSSFKEFSQQADQIAARPQETQVAAPEQGSFALNYNKARGAVAPQADSDGWAETAARIERNRQRDVARVADMISDTIDTEIEEGLSVSNNLLELANRARTGNIDAQDVNTFKNWTQSKFQNDPVVLGEMNEILSSVTFSPKTSTNPVVSQAVEAIDTGADQAAMRVSRTVQRDPGENLTEFDLVQDAYEQRGASPVQAADAAVAATEGNVAFTQTDRPLRESFTARFLANERDEIASQLAEQGLLITPGRIEGELANRLGSQAYKYGPEYTQLKQNIQLGATYDPDLFNNPGKLSVRIAGEEVPTGRVPATNIERTPYTNELIAEDVELGLRQPTFMKETAERLQERAENKRDWLGSVRLEEASKNAKLNAELINTNRQYNETLEYSREITDFLDSKRGTPEQRTRARQRLDDVNYELDRLDVLSEDLNQAVYGGQSGARVRGAEKFTEDYIANLTPPSRLKPGIEEGQRLFFEVDELSGEPIPGTQELRSERKMVDMKPKGGGGRNVAEFSAGNRDEDIEIDLENILQQARTPRGQSAREYTKDQFGYRPGTGLTGEALEGQPFRDDRTQTGRVITRTGIQKTGPQPGSMKAAVNPYTQLDDETLGMISLQGSEADAANAARILTRRRREGYDPSTVTGPGQSQRVISSVALTPEQKQTKINSMDASQQIMALQRSGRPDAQKLVQEYIQKLQGGI